MKFNPETSTLIEVGPRIRRPLREAGQRLGSWCPPHKFYAPRFMVRFTVPGDARIYTGRATESQITQWYQRNPLKNDPDRYTSKQIELRRALEGSIKKWEGIAYLGNEERGMSDCPLCRKFAIGRPDDERCCGCPIAKKTGRASCYGSPYDAWSNDPSTANAEAMLRFLRGIKRELFP